MGTSAREYAGWVNAGGDTTSDPLPANGRERAMEHTPVMVSEAARAAMPKNSSAATPVCG